MPRRTPTSQGVPPGVGPEFMSGKHRKRLSNERKVIRMALLPRLGRTLIRQLNRSFIPIARQLE